MPPVSGEVSVGVDGWSFDIGIGSGSSGSAPFLSNLYGFGLPEGSIIGIVSSILSWALAIFGFIAVIGFVISGIMYLTAAGDEGQAEKAKKAMYWSIIGVVVGLSGLVVIQAIYWMLGGYSNF